MLIVADDPGAALYSLIPDGAQRRSTVRGSPAHPWRRAGSEPPLVAVGQGKGL